MLERQAANALAGRGKNRIQHSGRRDGNSRFAYAAPEPAGRHDDRLDLRHLVDQHDVIAIEILLLDAAVLDSDLAIERR